MAGEYHFHDDLGHKSEISHGRVRMTLEKTQAGGPCAGVDGDLCHWWDSDFLIN